jgi:hypothetical protein
MYACVSGADYGFVSSAGCAATDTATWLRLRTNLRRGPAGSKKRRLRRSGRPRLGPAIVIFHKIARAVEASYEAPALRTRAEAPFQ